MSFPVDPRLPPDPGSDFMAPQMLPGGEEEEPYDASLLGEEEAMGEGDLEADLQAQLATGDGLLPRRLADAVDYRVKLSAEEREDLGRRIVDEWNNYREHIADRLANVSAWRDDAALVQSDQEGPWDNASAVRSPYVRMACEHHTQRLNSQIGGTDPPFSARALKPAAAPLVPIVEDAVNARMEEAEWRRAMRLLHAELPIAAPAGLKVFYTTETIRAPRPVMTWDEDAFAKQVAAGVPPVRAYIASVKAGPDGKAEFELEMEEVVLYDGVRYEVVRFEDLVMLPHTARSIDRLWGVGERVMIRGFDLAEGAKVDTYDQEDVDVLLERGGDPENTDQEELLNSIYGVDSGSETLRGPLYESYECLDVDWKDDLNKDGWQEWYRVTVHCPTARVLRCIYNPDWHAHPAIVIFPYVERAGVLYGETIAERMAVLQDAATACINQFFDSIDKMVGSAGFIYDNRGSKKRPDEWNLDPAMPIKVDAIEGIMPNPLPPMLAQTLPHLLVAMEKIKDWSDLLTGTSNIALGKETSGSKTLGEVQLVRGMSDEVHEDYAAGVAQNWARVADMTRWLLAQYSDRGLVRFRRSAMADEPFGEVPFQVLAADVDMVPTAMSNLPNKGQRLQRDLLVMQQAATSQLLQGDWETFAEFFATFLRDVSWPDAERLSARLRQRARQMMEADQIAAELAMQQQQQAGAAAAEAQAGEQQAAGQAAEREQQSFDMDAARTEQELRHQEESHAKAMSEPPSPSKGKSR